jgi:NADH dehydrogenase FAD-containing subunit
LIFERSTAIPSRRRGWRGFHHHATILVGAASPSGHSISNVSSGRAAAPLLAELGVEVRTGARVTEVGPDGVH